MPCLYHNWLLNAFRTRVEDKAMNALGRAVTDLGRFVRLPAVWSGRAAIRTRLAAMPERLLADIGLDRAAVAREARRPVWQPFGACLERYVAAP
jgi:uncharacterized protein YjiS (DUF1127 family)